ncbi:MAG: divalent-cation tolerance protein CutA [Chloracidobacterium sp.]|nr:divalent-cation tolerance protein CutA [Chloracidobacterium sp.]MCO5332853.1 divalent-cation tolerance protein CutA [Pyrinomonadaceae bacterium]
MLIIFTTVPEINDANALAAKLVETRLAACVQILPKMTSVFMWKGEMCRESEHLLLIKTVNEKWDAIHEFLSAEHPYEVPEIIAIDADRVSEPYLQWATQALARG